MPAASGRCFAGALSTRGTDSISERRAGIWAGAPLAIHGAPASLGACLRGWRQDHAGLHVYAAMPRELDRRFAERYFRWLSYLYGELGGRSLEAEERRLLDAGELEPTGLRYVGAFRQQLTYRVAGHAAPPLRDTPAVPDPRLLSDDERERRLRVLVLDATSCGEKLALPAPPGGASPGG
jgi:hypothetical protein